MSDTKPIDHAIFMDGDKIGTISNFSISNKLSPAIKLPPLDPIPPLGEVNITGTITTYFEDPAILDGMIAKARADEDAFCDWYARTQQQPADAYEDEYPSGGIVIPLWAGLIAIAGIFGIVLAIIHHGQG